MSCIHVKLFGTPTVLKDCNKILFPFRKAEALFYYLVCNRGEASRQQLVYLLWGDVSEDVGKKNLRNAMYQIRKTFDMDIVISPQKSLVMLNPDIGIKSDIDEFSLNNDTSIKMYTGDFLQGFSIKDGYEFEEWMFSTREAYRDRYIALLFNKINEKATENCHQEVEQYAKLLINVDPFDERPYRVLMEMYCKTGAYNKGIETYHRLERTLHQELGIKPDIESIKLHERLLSEKTSKKASIPTSTEDYFYGREKELKFLFDNYRGFIEGKHAKSIIIRGEAGIGKTKVKEKFISLINNKDVYVLQSNCYQAEENYVLKPWNTIFNSIKGIVKEEGIIVPPIWKKIISYVFPDFAIDDEVIRENPVEEIDYMQFKLVEDAVAGLLEKLSVNHKIILLFDDIQWMDNKSLALLKHIIKKDNGKRILFIGTSRNQHEERVDSFVVLLNKDRLLDIINLERFSKEEVEVFIKGALPNKKLSNEMKNRIYTETEGNTFFLVEYLKALKEDIEFEEMSSKINDVLRSRFINISPFGKKLLDIISIFFDKATLDVIQGILGIDEMQILDGMEELTNKYLIVEAYDEEKITYHFTHQKLQEYIYTHLSTPRKKFLHNKIAEIIEGQLKNDKSDIFVYSKLIYHYTNSGNKVMSLKYQIQNLNAYLDFSHELFPVINEHYKIKEKNLYLTSEEAATAMAAIEEELSQIAHMDIDVKQYLKLKLVFQHMKGRYLIQQGEYNTGINYIMDMMKDAEEIQLTDYLLKGYRQMIYYGIQTHNTAVMQEYIEKALWLAEELNSRTETAILLRLKGLCKIMTLEYDEAEEILQRAIHLFNDISKHEEKYLLNIAAVYNYLGEIRRYNMKFSNALKYYEAAISICSDKKATGGLTILYTNAGQAAFELGDYVRAKGYFNKAIQLYNEFDLHWGRSIAEGYMALLNLREGSYKMAVESLKKADECSKRMKNPYELGLVYRVKAEIKVNLNNHKIRKAFQNILDLTIGEYCDKGIYYLNQVKECYEMEILKVLRKNTKA